MILTINKKEDRTADNAYAYTPGLKVKHRTVISQIRRLPITGKVLVNVGDKVSHNTKIAETFVPGDPEVMDIGAMLAVDPENLKKYMVKKVGDPVNKGDVCAQYDYFFGLKKRNILSPVDGSIESISNFTGQVTFRTSPIPVSVDAYIPGKIVEILPNEGAIVATNAAFVQGIFGIGGETHGEIRMKVSSPEKALTLEDIKEDDKNRILVGGSYITLDALRKAVEIGVSGIIVGSIEFRDLIEFMGGIIGVAITGQEELGLTLIITEGFGTITMSQRTFSLLQAFEGYFCSINGATQIRAGVIRPEIIIPHEKDVDEEEGEELSKGMTPGTPIRIIREPYFGLIGKVSSLPIELQKVDSRSFVRVLEAELDDGRKVIVPRANVEIIEE
jgi:hypothetical protein